VSQLRDAIDRFVKAYNAHATPFDWRKRVVHTVGLKHLLRRFAQLKYYASVRARRWRTT
jgi:hypothetical protein